MPTPPLPPRYELLGILGEGGMGRVYRVLDRDTGHEIALKRLILPDGPDAAQARFLFRQEFWAMASLRHPNLVEALDYGEGPDDVPYMTMALVPGEDLDVTPPGQAEAVVRGWLPQVGAALAFLHGRGFVHGDLKPENVRIEPAGAARLMDLGLLAPSGRAGEPISGSIAYMAPEVIRQGAIDARSDLYALGAVLYHALTGRPPFAHPEPMVVLRAHLDSRPERLGQRNADVTPEMDAAVMRLLAKEPTARFASVGELLAALGLQAVEGERATLLASPILGRDDARGALRAAWSPLVGDAGAPAARQHGDEPGHDGAAHRVWLLGADGSGKTRLLGEARAEAQLAGLQTVVIQGLGLDAAPYQALQPLFRALAPEAQAHQPALAPVLARVLPEMAVAPAAPLDGVSERLRLQAAVSALARAVYPRALWLVDGADRLDPASSELLTILQKEIQAHWAWTWAGEVAPAGQAAVELGALPDDVLVAIAAQLLGQDALPAGLGEALTALAAGSPGAVEALLGHWIEMGALTRTAGRWSKAGDFALPGGLRDALDARLAALGDDARSVARTASVLGAAGDLRWLAGVAGLPDERFFAALRDLVAADLLVVDDRSYRFVRPPQATGLAAGLAEDQARELHDRAADWLASEVDRTATDVSAPLADALAIAGHALAGARPRRAMPWVLAAVHGAVAQFTLEPAVALLARALLAPDLEDTERLELERLQVVVWWRQGRMKDALARFDEADLLGRLERRGDAALTEMLVIRGSLLSVAGRYDEARQGLAKAMQAADAGNDPANAVRARIYAGRAAYFMGDAEAARAELAEAVARGRAAQAPGLAIALAFHGYFQAAGGGVDAGLAALAEAVALAQASGNPVQANEALSMRGNICVAEGRPLEAREAFEAILTTCRQFELPYDELMARLNLAATLLEIGEIEPAREHAEHVAAASLASQRKFPEAYARAVAGRARIHQGQLAAGEAELAVGLTIAREIGSKYLELHAMVPWIDALIALGRRDATAEALAAARAIATEIKNTEHDGPLDRLEMRAMLQAAISADAPLAALATAGERLSGWATRMRAEGRGSDLAHALFLQASWALRCGDLPAGTTWSDEALVLAKQAGLKLLAVEIGHVRGKLAFEATLSKPAIDYFNTAGEAAEQLGDIRLDLLCTAGALAAQGLHRERATIAKRFEGLTHGLGPDDATAFLSQPDLSDVMRTLAPMGLSSAARDLLGLMAKFDGDADLATLLKKAVATMVHFAGAERGFLLLLEDLDVTHKVYYGMSADDADEFSGSLAYEVLWRERPLYVEDAQIDRYFKQQASVRALDLRSVVGVPLAIDGKVIGVMIGDSQQITSGFGDYHLELLEALARRVATAIGAARQRMDDQRQAGLDAMLGRVAMATAAATDLDGFMAPVAAEALALAAADRLCLVVGAELACRAAFDKHGQALPPAEQAPSLSTCRYVYESGESLHLHDVTSSEAFGAQRSVMALGLRTIHAVPVTHRGQVGGVLYLDDRHVGREDPHVMEALRQLGKLVGALLSRLG